MLFVPGSQFTYSTQHPAWHCSVCLLSTRLGFWQMEMLSRRTAFECYSDPWWASDYIKQGFVALEGCSSVWSKISSHFLPALTRGELIPEQALSFLQYQRISHFPRVWGVGEQTLESWRMVSDHLLEQILSCVFPYEIVSGKYKLGIPQTTFFLLSNEMTYVKVS